MKSSILMTTVLLVLGATARLHAASTIFNISADGIKEVSTAGTPGQGDLDGSAIGTLLLDNGTGAGTTGFATFNLSLTNIDLSALTGHHIHQSPATTTGSIVLNFGNPNTILTGSTLSGTVTGLSAITISGILASPSGLYYNLHNGAFPGGAVRDQLAIPEPTSAALLLLGAGGWLAGRRRRA